MVCSSKHTHEGLHFLISVIDLAEKRLVVVSRVRLSVTPWTAAHQAPPSLGFSRQEYWSGLPLPSLLITARGPEISSPEY